MCCLKNFSKVRLKYSNRKIASIGRELYLKKMAKEELIVQVEAWPKGKHKEDQQKKNKIVPMEALIGWLKLTK